MHDGIILCLKAWYQHWKVSHYICSGRSSIAHIRGQSSKCKHYFTCLGCEPFLSLETTHAWNECRQAPHWCNNAYCSKFVRVWRLKPAKHLHYSNLTTPSNASTLYFHTYILMQKLLILPVSTFLIYSFETPWIYSIYN